MRKLVLSASVALTAMIASAQAADLMDMPVGFDWSGVYMGGHLGYGFGENTWRNNQPATTPATDLDGLVVGGVLGYNWLVSPSFMLGVETDFNASKVTSTNNGGIVFACPSGVCRTKVDWFGSTRARLGYTMDASMFFVTGGVAYGYVDARDPIFQRRGDVIVGWTVGAGFERNLVENLTAKIEYLYTDLGRRQDQYNCGFNCYTDVNFHTVRIGLNYHF